MQISHQISHNLGGAFYSSPVRVVFIKRMELNIYLSDTDHAYVEVTFSTLSEAQISAGTWEESELDSRHLDPFPAHHVMTATFVRGAFSFLPLSAISYRD